MNAYELAGLLHKNAGDGNTPIRQAANMLRQQADRIAELEKALKPIKCIVKDCENHKHEGGFTGDLCNPCYEFITTGKGIYSQAYRNTKTKPLSDEEILTIADKCGLVDYRPAERKIYSQFERGELENFARAILRKAQEK